MKKVIVLCLIPVLAIILVACGNKTIKVNFIINSEKKEVQTYAEHENYNDTFRPYLEGYEFLGWYIDQEFITKYEKEKHSKNKELTLYANWITVDNEQLDALGLYLRAYKNMINSEYLHYESTGNVTASIASQELKSIKKKMGDTYYQYTATKGLFVKTYFEMYGNLNSIRHRDGKSFKEGFIPSNGMLNNDIKTMSQFITKYGSKPNELYYIVNKDTIISASKVSHDNNQYQFEITLDLEKATVAYKKNIEATNTQAKTKSITFKKIELNVIIDENFYFKSINYKEEYDISLDMILFGNQTVNADITDTFLSYTNNFEITPYFN